MEGHQDNQQVGRFGHPRRARTHEAGSERVRDEEERERKTGCQPVEEEAEEDEGKAVRWGATLLLTVARSLPQLYVSVPLDPRVAPCRSPELPPWVRTPHMALLRPSRGEELGFLDTEKRAWWHHRRGARWTSWGWGKTGLSSTQGPGVVLAGTESLGLGQHQGG